jgi:secondary thiamine-phosphate synthase enzyme
MRTEVLQLMAATEQVIDVTDQVVQFCSGKGDGLVNVFAPHATAGIALMETGSGSEGDLVAALRELLPRDDRYRHRHGSVGHGADHLLPVFVSPSVVVPVLRGQPWLGTWQRVVLVDLNSDNPNRQVRLSFIGAS